MSFSRTEPPRGCEVYRDEEGEEEEEVEVSR